MLVRALRSFAGPSISMKRGAERDLKADEAKRLIRAGHVEKVEKQPQEAELLENKEEVALNEDKSGNTE